MAFIVEKKVGETVYLYEATSSWDPNHKQSRQTRLYLGKKDPNTGTIIPPRHSRLPRRAKDYGNVYLLRQLADRIGVTSLLQSIFYEDAFTLLALMCFEITEAAPLYLFSSWVETSCVEPVKALSAAELTTFTQRLGQMDAEREAFFYQWIQRCRPVQTVVFDITSLSSYSKLIAEVEWGYNRDHDPLPQVNLGVVYAEQKHLPLYYQVYPGSIRDVSTLPNMVRYLEGLEVAPDLFVMDRGFYSAKNLETMAQYGFTFLMPLPRTVKLFSTLVTQHYSSLTALSNSFLFQDEVLGHLHTSTPLNQLPLHAHLYFPSRQHAEQTHRFLQRLWEAEAANVPQPGQSPQAVREALNAQMKGAAKFFRFRKTKQGTTMTRNIQRLTDHLLPLGVTVYLTNHPALDRSQILTLYRQKDFLEKTFDTLKHDCDGRRLRGHSTDAIMGRVFLKFLSLILYSAVTTTMRTQGLFTRYSVRELLCELKKIRLVEMKNGTQVLTEISKRQKDIFKAFKLQSPILKT
jgi:transposase